MDSRRSRLVATLAGCACALLLVAPGAALAKQGGGKPAKPKPPAQAELVAKARAAFEAKVGANGTIASFSCKRNGSKGVTCRGAGTWTADGAPEGSTFKGTAQARTICRKKACTVRATGRIVVTEPAEDTVGDDEDVLSGGGTDDVVPAPSPDGEPGSEPGSDPAPGDLPGRPSHPFDDLLED